MSNPLVTVITSTYNWPEALRQSIKTCLWQDFADFEYLVIGDACSAETEETVCSFSDPRIRWFNLSENTGNQSGVNKVALEKSRGTYIAYLNHDDLWFPDHLSTLVSVIASERLDIINSTCLEIPIDRHPYRGIQGLPFRDSEGCLCFSPVTTTVMHSKEASIQAGGWIDWRQSKNIPTIDFFARIAQLRGRYAIVPKCTAIKFNSADRANSYINKDAGEQIEWSDKILSDPTLREREVMIALSCMHLGEQPPRFNMPELTANFVDGWQVEMYRRVRGLQPMLELDGLEIPEISKSKASRISRASNGMPIIRA
jgi:glycosyltransferase involved in cell wall biosynthesis